MKNIALYGRFGEPAASIFWEHPPPGYQTMGRHLPPQNDAEHMTE